MWRSSLRLQLGYPGRLLSEFRAAGRVLVVLLRQNARTRVQATTAEPSVPWPAWLQQAFSRVRQAALRTRSRVSQARPSRGAASRRAPPRGALRVPGLKECRPTLDRMLGHPCSDGLHRLDGPIVALTDHIQQYGSDLAPSCIHLLQFVLVASIVRCREPVTICI